MMKRDARQLLLLSRSGPRSQAAKILLLDLELGGVTVFAPACDVGDEKSLIVAINQCDTTEHPIKGCIHGAMALKVRKFFFL